LIPKSTGVQNYAGEIVTDHDAAFKGWGGAIWDQFRCIFKSASLNPNRQAIPGEKIKQTIVHQYV
jgi:hypothetical protein